MVDYIKTRKEILNIFYNTFSGDTLYTMPKEEIVNALDEILLDGVKFKHATKELTRSHRKLLKETIKAVLIADLDERFHKPDIAAPINKIVEFWKGE